MIADTVYLKSGSPPMRIRRVWNDHYVVTWEWGPITHIDSIPIHCVTPFKPREEETQHAG